MHLKSHIYRWTYFDRLRSCMLKSRHICIPMHFSGNSTKPNIQIGKTKIGWVSKSKLNCELDGEQFIGLVSCAFLYCLLWDCIDRKFFSYISIIICKQLYTVFLSFYFSYFAFSLFFSYFNWTTRLNIDRIYPLLPLLNTQTEIHIKGHTYGRTNI